MSKLKVQSRILKLKSKLKSFAILVLVLSFGFWVLSSDIFAQQVSLAISPPIVELVIKPGKSVLIAYKLENHGDPVIMKSNILPFQAGDNFGNIKIKPEFDGPIRFNLDNSEIKLDQAFFLKSNSSQQLLLRVRVPEGAPEGDYYYTFLSETQPPPIQEGVSTGRAKATIGSNILITVTQNGDLNIKGGIALFDVLAKVKFKIFNHVFNFFESSDKIPVVLVVNNKGKNMVKPHGEIKLVGNFGEKASYDIFPQNILAESQRQLVATPSASFSYPKPVTLLLSGFFIGHYKLSTTMNFGTGTSNLYASTSFIALPLKLIAALIIAISIVILIIKKTAKTEDQ